MVKLAKSDENTNEELDKFESLFGLGELRLVPLDEVERDPNQPRSYEEVMDGIEDFAKEIEAVGWHLSQKPEYHIKPEGGYMIVAGERRTEAFRHGGKAVIPAVCRVWKAEEIQLRDYSQYIENDRRETNKKPLTAMQDAEFWKKHIDTYYGGKASAAAKALGRDNADISNRLSLLKADETIQRFVEKNKIRDPGTFAALNRLFKQSSTACMNMMTNYESGSLKGQLRIAADEKAKDIKAEKQAVKQAKNQEEASLPILDEPGVGFDGDESKQNYMLDLQQEGDQKKPAALASAKQPKREVNKGDTDLITDAIFQAQELLNKAVFDAQVFAGELEVSKETQAGVNIDEILGKLNQAQSAIADSIEFYESVRAEA